MIFQDLDWVPANHAQAEDRCYRLGQTRSVTVEYVHAEGSFDAYIARLLAAKMALISAVEADEVPDASILAELEADLRRLTPALLAEARLATSANPSSGAIARLAAPKPSAPGDATGSTSVPLAETGIWEFTSERDPGQTYRVTFGRAGHLECTCKGFGFRGNCKHVREVRAKVLTAA